MLPTISLPAYILPTLQDVIAHHRLTARKALSQNFILDSSLIWHIVRAAGNISTGTVVEIGSGPGGLTRALLANGAQRVVAVECDKRCLPILAEVATAWPDRLIVLEADALILNLADVGEAPRHIVANLPYHIATALLLRWLKELDAISDMTLMFQKEVANRLCAMPQSKDYGRLSVVTQWLCHTQQLFDLPPQVFTPPPLIISTVVHLKPRQEPLASATWPALEAVTAAAFGQRRKMLRQSLKRLGKAEALCATAGLPSTARAEEIDIAGFCALARAYERSCS